MRILLVNKFLYPNGGSETYIFKLGEYLEKLGHEVQYFGMEDERNIVGNHANSYTTNYNFHTSSIKKLLYPIQIIYSSEARKKIRKVLADFKPEVVHLNNINFQLTPSILYEIKKYKIPMVMTAHDYQLVCPNHMMYIPQTKEICERCMNAQFKHCSKNRCIHGSRVKSFLGTREAKFYYKRRTYSYLDKIICPSHFLETKFQTDAILRDKTCTLHNFIDSKETVQVVKKDYVLYFGRFADEKGIGTLIQACKELPQIQFIFAGSGPLEDQIAGVPNIKNVGFQTGKALEQLVREAKFTLYPSEWYENCPFSVMESQMYQTPVIGANIGGIPELIQEGKTGLLFESRNKEDLKEKIALVWNNNNYLEQLTKGCQTITFDTIETYCDKLLKIYQEFTTK